MDDEMLQIGKQEGETRVSTGRAIRCHRDSCDATAICFLENRFLCVTHFISYCYERLEECRSAPLGDAEPARALANVRFLRECSERAANLVPPARGLPNLERARLFDILLWASELLTQRLGQSAATACTPDLRAAQRRD